MTIDHDQQPTGGPHPTWSWLDQRASQRHQAGLRRRLSPRQAIRPNHLDLASNDYLGLATDPRVISAAAAAAGVWGAGATGSRLVTGSTALHQDLESELARFVGADSALVFSSGYLANIGAITALSDKHTLIVSDALNHASLIDAIRLTGAPVVVTAHRDVDAVNTALAQRTVAKALVVTDAVFSVDGDLAPLRELHLAARTHDALLVVDEAHAIGVIGEAGAGGCEAAGVSGEPDVVMTLTLSKSLGSQGGAVAGTQAITDHLVDTARSFIFDTGLAPASAGAAQEALRIIAAESWRVANVRRRARELRDAARSTGWQTSEPDGAVVSVFVGSPDAAVAAAAACAKAGVHVGCFRPPSVPDGRSRLRLTSRATLTDVDMATATAALAIAAQLEDQQ
ncbi:MAG: 8-amino-7-oxononanoate synthase [Candidatus Nanopelagicales bacterium]